MKIEQNISRLNYLLQLYKLSVADLLVLINKGLKKAITEKDILSDVINVSYLKRIDKVFNKGIHYYLDPTPPVVSQDASIFFRKNDFGTELNIGAKKIVNQFEEFKIFLSGIAKLAEFKSERIIPIYSAESDSKKLAQQLRNSLYPEFILIRKSF